jgi:hypothetical protein
MDRYVDRLAKGSGEKHREAVRREYPPQKFAQEVYTTPLILVDRHRRIITWYLPKVISMQRQVGIFALI